VNLLEIGFADWMEQAQDHAEWKTFILAVLNVKVLLP
jgi:hypothetical protein